MATAAQSNRWLGKSALLIALSLLLLASLSSAIDLTKAFGGKKMDRKNDNNQASTDAVEDAVANAKKLVDDMNDASTGTVTSYSPNREKEPVTCNDIMAKALVVANEEKAAIIEERDSVVKAASLLSDRIDDLTEQLNAANEQVELLKKDAANAQAKAEKEIKEQMNIMTEDANNAQAKADKEIKEMKEFVAEIQKNATDAIQTERDQSKSKMDKLRKSTEEKIEAIKESCYNEVTAAQKDRNEQVNKAERRIKDAQDQAAKEIKQAIDEADARVATIQKKADENIAAITADAMSNREAIIEKTEAKMEEMKKQIQAQAKGMADDVAKIKESSAAEIKRAHADAEARVKYVRDELDKAVAIAEAKVKAEREEAEKFKVMLDEAMKTAFEKEKALSAEIAEAEASSANLHNEITFWRQTHDSQNYCNMTLIKQDSRQIVMKGIRNAQNGLEVSQEFLMDLFGKQLANVHRITGDITLYIQKEMIPSIQLVIDNGRVKAIALYDEHLADVVNQKVIPAYNEHIYPVYNEHIQPAYKQHVAPLVKTIEKEAAVAIEKSQKEAQKARSSAASLVKQSSSSAIKLIEEKEADSILPSWILKKLEQSSKDGESVVDTICKGLFILLVILCRSLIYRFIGFVFSIVWFFCPLRLLMRQSGGINEDSSSGKMAQDKGSNVTKSNGSKVAGKNVKMY